MYGIGASLVYYPAVGAPSRWFETRRGLALGLAMSGVGVGAAIDAVGIYWTLRILAILCAVICGSGSIMLRIPGSVVTSSNKIEDDLESIDVVLESRSTNSIDTGTGTGTGIGFISKLKVFKDPQFLSLTIAQLVSSFGLFIPLYYLQTYAIHISLTPQNGALIAGLSSGASCFGRIILGLAADRMPKTVIRHLVQVNYQP
ncbi:MAG: major facilitator superfamily domain-containing protein [Linnemannia gamsii]|nr:MAG: major facilitator superfamily domain-containing protein [Linnemannia gamsii]